MSIRLVIYDALGDLAEQRGVSLASLVDRLASAELAAAGVTVPGYIPPSRGEPKRRRGPKPKVEARPAAAPVPVEKLTEALDQFNRARGYTPAKPVATLRADAAIDGNVQSQHIEL